MHFSLAALAACVSTAYAFKDTSPFLFFSTSELPLSLQESSVAQIQNSKAILDTTKEFLSSCPTDVYYIVHQPSILSSDLSTPAIISLQRALSAPAIKAKYMVSEALGLGSDVKQELLAHLQKSCGGTQSIDLDSPVLRAGALDNQISEIREHGQKAIILQTMQGLAGPSGSSERIAMLDKIDRSHESDFSTIAAERSYTIIWTTTPPSGHSADVDAYEPEFQNPVHIEIKRDLGARRSSARSNNNESNQRPLFEKYQFFTPGLFMGLLTGFIFIAMLSVGLKAISSLQVSYAAFDKDMGPAAQKKQS